MRKEIMAEALALIDGDRARDYGDASVNFKRIAERWSQLLGLDQIHEIRIQPWQVAALMIDLKLARLATGYKHDTAADIIGYAALMAELAEASDDGYYRKSDDG